MRTNAIEMPYDLPSLQAAWEMVLRRGSAAGCDGLSIEVYAQDAGRRLRVLSERLQRRTYVPAPLRRFAIAKPDGGVRVLAIPTVTDRIAQRAALTVLEPALEAHFLASSYAYRHGRSVQQAVARVSALRNEGYEWIAHMDVKDCFDSLDWRILMKRLSPFAAPALRLLVRKWIAAPGLGYDWCEPVRGIPQGGVLSPALCNLVLHDLDASLYHAGIPSVRYADDLVLFAKTKSDAEAALALAVEVLAGLMLEANPGKTEVTSFDTGFRFLGTLFVRSIVLPCLKIKTDSGRTRYVSGYGTPHPRRKKVKVYRGKGHICVEGSLPRRDLERFVARAVNQELLGRSSVVGRALMDAWKKELARGLRDTPRRLVTPESVALL
jgi:CRISPR-associated protein Cas1